MSYKIPYITAKMIFTQLVSESSASHTMTTVNNQKMLVSPSVLHPHPRVILPKALVLQDESFGKNYSSLLDFTRNYEWTSGIFVP